MFQFYVSTVLTPYTGPSSSRRTACFRTNAILMNSATGLWIVCVARFEILGTNAERTDGLNNEWFAIAVMLFVPIT